MVRKGLHVCGNVVLLLQACAGFTTPGCSSLTAQRPTLAHAGSRQAYAKAYGHPRCLTMGWGVGQGKAKAAQWVAGGRSSVAAQGLMKSFTGFRVAAMAWIRRQRATLACMLAVFLITMGGAGPAAASTASTHTPGSSVPDLTQINPGNMPFEQWAIRDELAGVTSDPNVDMSNYRLPGDEKYLTKGTLFGKKLEQVMTPPVTVTL
ncbi:unnamed protein product [Chrysoparadoxa australica]